MKKILKYDEKVLIISLLFLLVCPLLHAQEEASSISILNRVVPPSPEAAALARYGEYPVGHTTGVPKIEIPLYDIQLGDYHLPISISYHASGIRVDDEDSYDEDGNLKEGLFEQAIFFSDNESFERSTDKRGKEYNMGSSTAYVYLKDGTMVRFNACTIPS